jgi:hypothetical protein
MEGFGAAVLADDYREQTAELSQEFAEFGSDFKPIDPACYAPGGAPGCEFGAATLKSKGWGRLQDGWKKDIGKYVVTIGDPRYYDCCNYQIYNKKSGRLKAQGWTTINPTEAARLAHRRILNAESQGGFGRMGVPAGMQLPPSWGVPDASMVRPGETPAGWDANLFRGFGGRFDKAALRKQREDFKTIYRDADIDLRKATDRYHANPTLSALTQVRKFGNRRNKAWKKMMKIQDQLGNKGLPFVAPVADPWWNQ